MAGLMKFVARARVAGPLPQVRSSTLDRRTTRRLSRAFLVELLESRVLMHANPVLDAEHLAVFGSRDPATGVVSGGLLPDTSISYVSVAATTPQEWSDPSTWRYVGPAPADGSQPSPIPSAGANVLISDGSTVVVDTVFTTPLHAILTDGTLRFDPHSDTLLVADTILVTTEGVFQMGTDPTLPDPLSTTGMGERIDVNRRARVIFADSGPIDVSWDPLQFSRGLVSHGEISIFGTEVTSFEQLAVAAKPKDKTLVLADMPTGWKVGDRLVLTGDTATNSKNVNRDEEVQIVSINFTPEQRSVITITDPKVANWGGLKYNHAVATGYVADVSRNATFESQNVTTVAQRGHVMFMHNDDVHVDSAGFYGLGRTDKRTLIDDPAVTPDPANPGHSTTDIIDSKTGQRVMVPVIDARGNPVVVDGVTQLQVARSGLNPRGRYAVHFHRAGTDEHDHPATISGSAVVDSPGWGIVNHSSNVDISGNVVFNAVGAAFVTEAGDEIGTFDGNIAIHSQGSGAGIESRERVQDFGHQGNGFWLQGGNVSVTNNVVAGQRAGAYIFFPVGLEQKGLGKTQIHAHDLANPAWAKPGQEMISVGDVPLREFSGNVAFASANGLETWFTLLGVNGQHADQRNLIEDFTAFALSGGRGVFTPYTNLTTLKDVTLFGNPSAPKGTAFSRNDVTRNIVYDHVHAIGWEVGIDAPVNGTNEIDGGFINAVKGVLIRTANSRSRAVNINGNTDAAGNLDPGQPQFGTLSAAALDGRRQYDISLSSNFNPKENDITRLFNPDVIQMGTVTVNDRQLYYKEQAADFKPFDSTDADGVAAYVPAALVDLTNGEMFEKYGLAVGGIVAPVDASDSNLRIDALIGSHATYQPDLQLWSKKYVNQDSGAYFLSYRYFDPSNVRAKESGYVTVKEATPTLLANGWNLVTREILGSTRTLLVFGDNLAPTFVLSASSPTTINLADIHNGTTFVVEGAIIDNSFGSRHFRQEIKLDNPEQVSAVQTDATGSFVIVTVTVRDRAGNASKVRLRFEVSETSTLVKDIGRKELPTIEASDTLKALLTQL